MWFDWLFYHDGWHALGALLGHGFAAVAESLLVGPVGMVRHGAMPNVNGLMATGPTTFIIGYSIL